MSTVYKFTQVKNKCPSMLRMAQEKDGRQQNSIYQPKRGDLMKKTAI